MKCSDVPEQFRMSSCHVSTKLARRVDKNVSEMKRKNETCREVHIEGWVITVGNIMSKGAYRRVGKNCR